jgi:tetratricopeptide (TPR) repeat protein
MKVFVSSTAQDLVAHRKVADDIILRLSHDAVVMERFGPLPGEPVAECERKARESDVVVCILAHRYGFVPEKGRGSITRREVEAARKAGKDVLVWIVADDYPWTEKKEQDILADPTVLADPARVAEVAAGVQSLLDFKAWLRKSYVCEAFTTPDDLGQKIAVTLHKYIQDRAPKRPVTAAPVRGEVRIVHALQPAPHFRGRDALVEELKAWVSDLASPDRVWSLVAAGGTGKTAVVERVVAGMNPGEANVLVWSFYERPDADAFLRECNQLFLGEDEGPAGGRLERLERGLRDGRPHLIVLDGLERVQEDAGGGRVRGELSDHSLKLLLRALAAGLGRARALVTSRFPLVDLGDWTNRGYRDTRLDDLPPDAAVAVLRGWGVSGDEAALRTAAAQVGHHALSLAVLGSYLRSFAGGSIEAVKDFDLDAVTGDDPKAAKLARVLAYYAQRLPAEERELLARLSVFARGVTLDLLGVLIDAGGEVAGLLFKAKPRLVALLGSLRNRGLVFQYRSDATVTWTAHPFLRERFRELLGCPPERVFDVVAQSLGAGLEKRPDTKSAEPAVLDRYERLIEATRLAGREQEALELYWYGLGEYGHLGHILGEYERGYRILAAFGSTGRPEDLGPTMELRWRSLLANDLALFAMQLGRLAEARAIRRLNDAWLKSLAEPAQTSVVLRNSSEVASYLGRLTEARALAAEAVDQAVAAKDDLQKTRGLAYRAHAAHALGDVAAARADFDAATKLDGRPLSFLMGSYYARHHLDLGELGSARALADHGLATARRGNWNIDVPRHLAMLARVDLAEGRDPTPHLDEIRAWTSRTGDMRWIIEAHLLTARHLLARGDTQAAAGEAETGLLHAVACGYGLLRTELLVALARVRLAWPDAPKAIQASREALDLAAHPDCGYAWGEADAAQAWGEAYLANGERALARRAFKRALEVRRRIEHPGTSETERWLARTV